MEKHIVILKNLIGQSYIKGLYTPWAKLLGEQFIWF